MFEELKKLIGSGQTKIAQLKLDIHSNFDWSGLLDLLRDKKIEISEIEIGFHSKMSLEEKGQAILNVLPVLEQITGVKKLVVTDAVKDWVLKDLLTNPALLTLDCLEIVHSYSYPDGKHPSPVNTNAFFEYTLVDYLQQNKSLKSLSIEDNHGLILARDLPRLKKAIIEHPMLTRFDTGLSLAVIGSKALLANDSELIQAIASKLVKDPAVVKKARTTKFDTALSTFIYEMSTLNDSLHWQKRDASGWLSLFDYLETIRLQWKRGQITYSKLTDQDIDHLNNKKLIISVINNYLELLVKVAYLQSFHLSPTATRHRDTLERFWDATRIELWKDIHSQLNKENPDFTEALTLIKSQMKEFTQIHEMILPTVYPNSYQLITDKAQDGLLKAKLLLQDYTKNDSALSRFFHGHWMRNHVSDVSKIVARINTNGTDAITSLESLQQELSAIKLVNQNGSLARRIKFINNYCAQTQEHALQDTTLRI